MKQRKIYNTSESVAAVGQGTGIGGVLAKSAEYSDKYIDALRCGISLGMNFIDTSEEYGMGRGEYFLGKAIKGIRSKVFIATKVSSEHLHYNDVILAAERSLRRLNIDYIDLYQIHWPNPTIPLEETMKAMLKLIQDGKIRYVGVCNFSFKELKKADALLSNKLLALQTEYNLFDRTIENIILPYCQTKNILTIAYSPLGMGKILANKKVDILNDIASKYNKTPAQIALNWLISKENIIVIPQSANPLHIKENAEAGDFELLYKDIENIDKVFTMDFVYVQCDRICVYMDDKKYFRAYKNIEEALENKFCMVPSPSELAMDILEGEVLKPIKVRKRTDEKGKYGYDLIEGRLRYWAWVIAYNGNEPVPVLVQE